MPYRLAVTTGAMFSVVIGLAALSLFPPDPPPSERVQAPVVQAPAGVNPMLDLEAVAAEAEIVAWAEAVARAEAAEAARLEALEAARIAALRPPAPVPTPTPPAPSAASQRPYADAAECTRAHEGWYTADTGNGYYGAYQFLQSTWNNTVRAMGREDLVGVKPSDASPADQDAAFWYLWGNGSGSGHWGNRCREYIT